MGRVLTVEEATRMFDAIEGVQAQRLVDQERERLEREGTRGPDAPCEQCGKPVPGGWSHCADCEREYRRSMARGRQQ